MRKTLLLFLSLLALSLQARQIIDLNTGKAFADTVLFSPERDVEYVEDGVCDQKASIGMRCSTGVKIAYMMVGGVPQPETMKMYVSR